MSEQSDEKNASEQDQQLDEAFLQMENNTIPVKRTSQLLPILIALVAIGLAAYSNFILYQQSETKAVSPIPAQLTHLQTQLKTYQDELAGVKSARTSTENQFQADLGALQATIQTFELTAPKAASSDWTLAEIKYLIRMANQRVLMERDPGSALALLKSADALLAESQNLTAFKLREALASDIANLQAVSHLDTEGLYLRFSALLQQTGKLQQHQPVYVLPEENLAAAPTATDLMTRLKHFLSSVGQRILSLVDFRRDQVEIVPILPPAEAYYLRQNLILKLQMSQRSLLDNNGEIYRQSVQQAIEWIEQYYDLDLPLTIAMVDELNKLGGIDVEKQIPDVSASLAAVRDFIDPVQSVDAQ